MIISLALALQAAQPTVPQTEDEADICSYANCYGSRIRRPELEAIKPVQIPLPGGCEDVEDAAEQSACMARLVSRQERRLDYAEREFQAYQDRHGGRMFMRIDESEYEQNFISERDAWRTYRDSSCRRLEMEAPDPRGEGIRELNCKLWMTEARVVDFEDTIGPVEVAE